MIEETFELTAEEIELVSGGNTDPNRGGGLYTSGG